MNDAACFTEWHAMQWWPFISCLYHLKTVRYHVSTRRRSALL